MSAVAIKISEDLAAAARAEAELADRSLTGQVEHWGKIGRSVEALLPAPLVAAIKRFGGDPAAVLDPDLPQRLREALNQVGSGSHMAQTGADLRTKGIPLYEADPEDPSGIVQVQPDGSKVRGTMVNRQFVPLSSS